tara:strand:- start:76 stop:750 length:675 start_codon:yes stop_codon:yes gene_type:complete
MKIAILGNGKMGKKISQLSKKRGHKIICFSNSKIHTTSLNFKNIDVAIDFSTPKSAFENISYALNNNTPVISGTTGWLDKLKQIEYLCEIKKGTFLYSSNFSLGVNIFFELNKKLAELLKDENYKQKIHEIHHTQKMDSPSGTAISLAEQINKVTNKTTQITSERIDNQIGIHQVTYTSELDQIEIKHSAKNRDGFAIGAIIAAEWIQGKQGVYNMQDVLFKKK